MSSHILGWTFQQVNNKIKINITGMSYKCHYVLLRSFLIYLYTLNAGTTLHVRVIEITVGQRTTIHYKNFTYRKLGWMFPPCEVLLQVHPKTPKTEDTETNQVLNSKNHQFYAFYLIGRILVSWPDLRLFWFIRP